MITAGPAIALIELGGAAVVAGHAAAALAVVARARDEASLARARLLVADGALAGLGFKLAATLLRTLTLHGWEQIGTFAAMFALRTLLKRLFAWERARLAAPLRCRDRAVEAAALARPRPRRGGLIGAQARGS